MSDQKRVLPQSELDFHLMTTDGVWGRNEISNELKERLTRHYLQKDKEGNILKDKDGNALVTNDSLWNLLGFYTRDLRLANLSNWNGEVEYCQYYLNLANDFLQANQIEPFLVSLSRVATLIELSQSKGGFLRRQMNTLTTQNLTGELEPPKKDLFGGKKKDRGGL